MKKTCSFNKNGKIINTFKSCYIDNGKPGYTLIEGKDKTRKCYDFKCKDIEKFLNNNK